MRGASESRVHLTPPFGHEQFRKPFFGPFLTEDGRTPHGDSLADEEYAFLTAESKMEEKAPPVAAPAPQILNRLDRMEAMISSLSNM